MKHQSLTPGELAGSPNVADLLTDEELARELLARILGREAEQPDLITERELVAELSRRVIDLGGRNNLAHALKVEPTDISKSLCGTRPISRNLARALGYHKVTRYERIS